MLNDFRATKKHPHPSAQVDELSSRSIPDADINIVMDDDDKIIEQEETNNDMKKAGSEDKVKKQRFKRIRGWWHGLSKKKKWLFVLFVVVIVALVLGAGYLVYRHYRKPEVKNAVGVVVTLPPKSTTVASKLTGVQVSPALASLPVTGVMIENSLEARPQSGLGDAGVVFEAEAEGGITRFLALFEEGQPSSIGPVRSARPYYIDWLLGFDAAYAHVGGSPDALSEIPTLGVKNMDEFYNGSYYERISSRDAPHNVYTSMANLLALEKSKGWTASNFKGFTRKKDQPIKTPTAANISFSMNGATDYGVNYTYNKTNDSYLRNEGGQPQIDANTNLQLNPKVVIAIVVPESQGALDASGAYYSDYQDIGSGATYIFQDGTVTTGTWQKASPTSQILFEDTNGKQIPLNAGQTWITAVASSSDVSYTN